MDGFIRCGDMVRERWRGERVGGGERVSARRDKVGFGPLRGALRALAALRGETRGAHGPPGRLECMESKKKIFGTLKFFRFFLKFRFFGHFEG